MSFSASRTPHFPGLGSCGIESAALVDIDSLLDTCLEEAQPGLFNYRNQEGQNAVDPATFFGSDFGSDLKDDDLDPLDIELPSSTWPPPTSAVGQTVGGGISSLSGGGAGFSLPHFHFETSAPAAAQARNPFGGSATAGPSSALSHSKSLPVARISSAQQLLQPQHLPAAPATPPPFTEALQTLGPSSAPTHVHLAAASGSEDLGDLPTTSITSTHPSEGTGSPMIVKGTLAERNKQAQRRHRMRAKARVETLEASIERLQSEKATIASERAALQGQVAMLTQVLHLRDEQLSQARKDNSGASVPLPAGDGEADSVDSLAHGILTLTVREHQEIHLTPAQVKAMAPDDLAMLWKEYVNQLALLLGRAGDEPLAELTASRINKLVHEALLLLMRVSVVNTSTLKRFIVHKVDKSQLYSTEENKELWEDAVRALKLSNAQRTAVIQLRSHFLEQQEQLQRERHDALSGLLNSAPDGVRGRDIAAQFLKAEECMSQLRKQLSRENTLICDLVATFFKQVLSAEQAARCLVRAYPWYPDSLTMCTYIAAEMGDRTAASLLLKSSFSPSPSSSLQPSQSGSLDSS